MRHFLARVIFFFSLPTLALAAKSAGFGRVAQNLLDPVSLFSNFISTACIVVGAGFLFASIVKYVEHKRSPLMVPISTVVFLVIAGLVLVLLPFIYLFTSSGIPYTLFR